MIRNGERLSIVKVFLEFVVDCLNFYVLNNIYIIKVIFCEKIRNEFKLMWVWCIN